MAELVEVGATADHDNAVAGGERLVAGGGNSTRPSARLIAITITPVRRPMSASRRVWPSSGLEASTGSRPSRSPGSGAGVTSSANSTADGLVRSDDDPVGADGRRQDDVVGAGLAELLVRARLLGPRDDLHVGGELARGEGDEHILGVRGHHRHEHLGALQAGIEQDFSSVASPTT